MTFVIRLFIQQLSLHSLLKIYIHIVWLSKWRYPRTLQSKLLPAFVNIQNGNMMTWSNHVRCSIYQSGGKLSRQTGHCNLYFIQLCKHSEWKI